LYFTAQLVFCETEGAEAFPEMFVFKPHPCLSYSHIVGRSVTFCVLKTLISILKNLQIPLHILGRKKQGSFKKDK
jgi:hypothetical protein